MPEPGHGEVLIKIHAVSVNYRDIAVSLALVPCQKGYLTQGL